MEKKSTKPRTPKKRAEKPLKKTAEELSDQQRQALLFQHKRKLKPLLAAEKVAKAATKAAYELAKKEGVTKKELDLAFLFETDGGEEKVSAEVERAMRIARWMGAKIGSQFDLFPGGKESARDKLFGDGKRAALDDQPCSPPAHLSQHEAQHWIDGHADGRAALNEQRATQFQPLGDAVAAAIDSLAAH